MAKVKKIFECVEWDPIDEETGPNALGTVTKRPSTCQTVAELIAEGKIKGGTPPGSALYHVSGPPVPHDFKPARNAQQIQKGDAYIVLGSDRPDSVRSGWGAKGAQKASTIDIVVGRMSSANGGKGPPPGTKVDNSFSADAARAYISQLTNVDTNFGLAQGGNALSQNGCSAVVLKADAVRLIGRQGIKIVTGKARGVKGNKHGEPNSRGGKIGCPAPPIELIAGNNVEPRTIPGGKYLPGGTIETLQPVPLGKNTRDALQELNGIVGELWSAVFNLALVQSGVNTALGVSPFAWQPAAVGVALPLHLTYVVNSLYHTRANASMWELNYCNPAGYKYICSRNVKTT
jgi:hypothetical protein|tara:strand:+ start:1346 stop:2383 length:1038 start_codon:yes stop_codon:yes gene_type:complete